MLASGLVLAGCVAAGTGALAYRSPPAPGTLVRWQHGLLRCEDRRGAKASAETGFLAGGCAVMERAESGSWRVVAVERIALSHGAMWLVEIVADGERRWLPIPWHDWA